MGFLKRHWPPMRKFIDGAGRLDYLTSWLLPGGLVSGALAFLVEVPLVFSLPIGVIAGCAVFVARLAYIEHGSKATGQRNSVRTDVLNGSNSPSLMQSSVSAATLEMSQADRQKMADLESALAAITLKEHRALAAELHKIITFFQTPTSNTHQLPNRITLKGPNHRLINGMKELGVTYDDIQKHIDQRQAVNKGNVIYCDMSTDTDKKNWGTKENKQNYFLQIAEMDGYRDALREKGWQ